MFKDLFGVEPSAIQKTAVITPFLSKGLTTDLGVGNVTKGQPFSTGQSENFTLIYSQIGSSQVGDAVLYLEHTSCEYMILIGACGLVRETDQLKVGTIVAPEKGSSYESFSRLLKNDYQNTQTFQADEKYLKRLLASEKARHIPSVHCATFGSVKLEESYLSTLKEQDVDVVDMECSAFFCAAQHIGRKAIALFYITDIIGVQSVFNSLVGENKESILAAQKNLTEIITSFTAP